MRRVRRTSQTDRVCYDWRVFEAFVARLNDERPISHKLFY